MKKRKTVIILESKKDLKQCLKGLSFLRQQVADGNTIIVGVCVRSAHQHPTQLCWLLDSLAQEGDIDAIIAAAGKAAVLPGFIDGYLRNHLFNKRIAVIGVALEGKSKEDDQAAILCIKQVPGTQVLFAGQGESGFLKACILVTGEKLPELTLEEIPLFEDFNLERAIELAEQQQG